MATAPARRRRRSGAAAETPAAEGTTPATPAAAPTAPAEPKEDPKVKAEEKRNQRATQEAEQTKILLARTGEHPRLPNRELGNDEPIAEVAKELNIQSGKAAFLLMKDAVAKGKVPKIEGADDDALVAAIIAARRAADEWSSWGWIAARADRSESWIKLELEDAGAYTPKAENISQVRAANRPQPEPTPEPAAPAEGATAEGGEAGTARRRRRSRGNAS